MFTNLKTIIVVYALVMGITTSAFSQEKDLKLGGISLRQDLFGKPLFLLEMDDWLP
ncbi:hypothetical protein [Pedobacter steynii]